MPPKKTPREIKKLMDRGEPVLFIDTRNPRDWGESNVKLPGARRVHVSELPQRLGEMPRDRLLVFYCT